MYESFYGLSEKPFSLLPDPEYLYLSPKHQRALTLLQYGMMNQAGFSVICGDTGAGKTTLIRRLLTELGDETSVGLITNTHQSFGELLNWVLMAFGLDGEGKSKAQMHQLFIEFLIEQYAQNKHAVLIVDEAQNMSADTLEELRMLSNINADKDQILQVILAGQPALRETLRKPELMQFAQRIAVDYYLEALSSEETAAYIAHRLMVAGADRVIFTEQACNAIYKYSGGTPRLINLLCDTSLVYGYAEQNEVINVQLVHDVVREQHSNSIIPTFHTSQSHKTDELNNHVPPVVREQVAGVAENEAQAYEVNKTEKAQQEYKEVSLEAKVSRPDEVIKAEQVLAENKTNSIQQKENDEIIADLAQRAVQAVTNADSGSVNIHGKPAVSVSRAVQAEGFDIKEKPEPEEVADKSNVTPIKVFQSEIAKDNVEENELPDNEKLLDDDVKFEEKNIEALMASVKQDDSDIYPIVHVDENPGKGLSMMVIGLVAGMFIASLSMVAIAWMFLNSNSNNLVQTDENTPEVKESLQSSERRELEIIQKERDAAIAVSRAMERERDAALSAAKIQEQMRAVEQRAAEILAEQERKAESMLREAQERARQAERAEAKALKRERNLKLKAEKVKLAELESKRLRLLKEEKQREVQLAEKKEVAKRIAQIKRDEDVNIVEKISVTQENTNKKSMSKNFSANPCNSPSAKFLSTCKK